MAGTNQIENIRVEPSTENEVSPAIQANQEDLSKAENRDGHAPDWEHVLQLALNLPHRPFKTEIMVSTREAVQDIRQSIVELPYAAQYSCFHLIHNGERLNDYMELSEVPGITSTSELTLVEDPYTEKEARLHLLRIKELVGLSIGKIDSVMGILAGVSLHDHLISDDCAKGKTPRPHNVGNYNFAGSAKLDTMLPPSPKELPACVKALSLSPWNPPPHHLRINGHLLYIRLITVEDNVFHITSHVRGFFVSRSNDDHFDPFPKPNLSKSSTAHSLLTLISHVSPSFDNLLRNIQDYNSKRDPLSTFQLSNALPANPWLVPHAVADSCNHKADHMRSQESYLMSGADGSETLRDWNEEFQSTRELQRDTVQDRVQRERLISKLFADYNESAIRGAMMVAHGEVSALNPTEDRKAQIFVHNNIFFSFGADGVGTFATDGGDEAARVAVSKDVMGVRAVNQLDIHDLFTPGTVVIDYLGQRIVGQSIVPGIFKQRAPGEHQIDYGGVEGKDIVTENQDFVPLFAQLSKVMRVKKHKVWDKENKTHILEGSVETKGLIGTDGRKYVLDLYRLTPLDIVWLEKNWSEREDGKSSDPEKDYPHRMANLRPELIDTYGRFKLSEHIGKKLAGRTECETDSKFIKSKKPVIEEEKMNEKTLEKGENKDWQDSEVTRSSETNSADEGVDVSDFEFSLNPDVFCGQLPQNDDDKRQMVHDEEDVRSVCDFLLSEVIPRLVRDLQGGDVGFPMDGQSLSSLLHKRGINIRYLGHIAAIDPDDNARLKALRRLAIREMITRAFKHLSNRYLSRLPHPFASTCIAHLLNCFLGTSLNSEPYAETDEGLKQLYPEATCDFEIQTPESLRSSICKEIQLRYRYDASSALPVADDQLQFLREASLKLGLQLEAKDYVFSKSHVNVMLDTETASDSSSLNDVNGINGTVSKKKRKKKGGAGKFPSKLNKAPVTFRKENILNLTPIFKDSSPRSTVADEALEAGRISLAQDRKEIGQELLLESLSLHEQIYGVLHPEVARAYYQLSTLYYGLDERSAAVDLARKAVVVAERTLGIDNTETVLSYLNLSLFEHAIGNSNAALHYVKHALDIWKIAYGHTHPDSITTINNAAVMLQSMKCYHDSRVWFEASLAASEEISGKQSVNTATLLFQLAQALALDQESREAVKCMRESYNLFRETLGSDDRNTKEAELWLEQLTQSAVSQARQAKLRGRRGDLIPGITLQTRAQPFVGQPSGDAFNGSDASRNATLDTRSVEELLRYIEGDPLKKTSKKKMTGGLQRKIAIQAR